MKPEGNFAVTTPKRPVLLYDYATIQKTLYLIKNWSLECQWYHRVEKEVEKTDTEEIIFYKISDIYIPEQECSAASIDSEGGMLMDMYQEIRTERNLDMSELGELMKSISVWCHSHVNMVCKPSGTDDNQWKEQLTHSKRSTSNQPQIMLIFNKRNEYFARIYDPDYDLEFTNPQLVIDHGVDFTHINSAIKDKLKKPALQVVKPSPKHPVHTPVYRQPAGYRTPITSTTTKTTTTTPTTGSNIRGGGSQALRQAIMGKVENSLDWKESLKLEENGKLASKVMGKTTGLTKKLNSTTNQRKTSELADHLVEEIDTHLVDSKLSWYTFYKLATSDSGEEVYNLTDHYLGSRKPSNAMSDYRDAFIEYISTMTIDPPEKLSHALQLTCWLDLSDNPDAIEGLLDTWINTYHEEFWSTNDPDDNNNISTGKELAWSGGRTSPRL